MHKAAPRRQARCNCQAALQVRPSRPAPGWGRMGASAPVAVRPFLPHQGPASGATRTRELFRARPPEQVLTLRRYRRGPWSGAGWPRNSRKRVAKCNGLPRGVDLFLQAARQESNMALLKFLGWRLPARIRADMRRNSEPAGADPARSMQHIPGMSPKPGSRHGSTVGETTNGPGFRNDGQQLQSEACGNFNPIILYPMP